MNTEKFTGKAFIYDKYRPYYAGKFIDYLYEEAGFDKNSVIADIGCGTGILSKQLLDRGSKVICVEPNENMRKKAEKKLSSYDNFILINGSAEKTGISKNSIDYIIIGQAFHWFDVKKFKTECQKIIKPKGKVVLVWNSRDTSTYLVKENELICRKLCKDFKGFSGGQKKEPESFSSFFKSGICEYKNFKNNLTYDMESFIGRNLSSSYAPKEGEINYNEFVEKLKNLFIKYSKNGFLTLPNITRSYVGKV